MRSLFASKISPKTGLMKENTANKLSVFFFFIFVGNLLGFLEVIIGFKWLVKAWGWIPILFVTFLQLSVFHKKYASLPPLFITEILYKMQQ